MIIWIAGNTIVVERERRILKIKKERLASFYFITVRSLQRKAFYMSLIETIPPKIFLDSGAFSAFTQNTEIDINKYIAFIKEHEQLLEIYANLDVIGNAKATWQNQKIMEASGLCPLPCFHYGEPIRYLKRYIDNYKYIALGGVAQLGHVTKIKSWMDPLWSDYLCNSDGTPKVKVHGFGLTSHKLMWQYPWYSVDSTSWVVTGRMGIVFVPKHKKGKWDYKESPWKVAVSNRSSSKKEEGKHFSTFKPMQQEVILQYLNSKGCIIGKSSFELIRENHMLRENERWCGKAANGKREIERIEERGLCNDYRLRDELNIIYYLDLEKSFPKWPYPFAPRNQNIKGLF